MLPSDSIDSLIPKTPASLKRHSRNSGATYSFCLLLAWTSTVQASSSCSEDSHCGWNSVCDQNDKLCQCLPHYTFSYNNIDCVNTNCDDSDCLQCTKANVCQRCVDYIEANTGKCLPKCSTDYHLFIEGDQLGKVCPEKVPSPINRVYLAIVIGIAIGIVLVILVTACLYWRIHADRKQKLRLKIMEKILERERLDGSHRSKSGSQLSELWQREMSKLAKGSKRLQWDLRVRPSNWYAIAPHEPS
ncbi:hypothetical protein LSAT2_023054 [Lamellibrachia satsuma]|nr:hypothetical protein LSAT2_023054 [Lamellibrachia satsuma]